MPKIEELPKQISTEITRVQNEPLWLSKISLIDLDYAYGQLKLSEETNNAILQKLEGI